jgi:hypothetical protein
LYSILAPCFTYPAVSEFQQILLIIAAAKYRVVKIVLPVAPIMGTFFMPAAMVQLTQREDMYSCNFSASYGA